MPEMSNEKFVLALTLFDGATLQDGAFDQQSLMLVGARSEKANPTHPNIVSVPTQRLPASLAQEILTLGPHASFSSETESGHNPLVFAVESLIATKVIPGNELESGEIPFTVSLAHVQTGYAKYSTSSDEVQEKFGSEELLTMLNLNVVLGSDAKVVPSSTASYSNLKWVMVQQFLKMMEDRDTFHVGLNPFGFCVEGLCVETSESFLRGKLEV